MVSYLNTKKIGIDQLRENLIVREMLKGNDLSDDILKINEIGLLKTICGNDCLKFHHDIREFLDINANQYTEKQKRQLYFGLLAGLDVNPYFKTYFSDMQMAEIRYGIEDEIDYSIYVKKEYDEDQMFELRDCMEKKIDVSLFADPSIDCNKMEEIKEMIRLSLRDTGTADIKEIVSKIVHR